MSRLDYAEELRGAPSTLDYLMGDYVGHLRHHLEQIDPEVADRLPGT